MLVLGRFDGDWVLDVACNDTVLCVYLERARVIDVVVVVPVDETLVPPLDVGRGFDDVVLLDIDVLVYAGLAGLGGDLLLQSLERGLAAQGIGLLNVLALLVEDELAGLSRFGGRGAEAGVVVRVALDLLGRRARQVDRFRLLVLGGGRGLEGGPRVVAAGLDAARLPLAEILESGMEADIQASLGLARPYGCRDARFESCEPRRLVYGAL